MNKLFVRLLKLVVIATFIYGLFTEQNYYSVFLRWFVFISSIYFAYRLRQVTGILGIRFLLIFNCALVILFNPFIDLGFREITWRIIDIIVCVLYAITLDWKGYKESLSPKGKLIYNLIKNCFWGVIASIVAVWFVGYSIKVNPYYEYMLITKSKVTNGFIIRIEEYEDEVDVPDSQGGGSEPVTVDNYEYTFSTQDGKVINNWSSDLGYIKNFTGRPLLIQVEYLPDNPEINRVKDETSQCKTLGEFVWSRLVLGMLLLLMFLSIGFTLIKNGIKEYLAENKKLNIYIQ
jgi:hypothetical protein